MHVKGVSLNNIIHRQSGTNLPRKRLKTICLLKEFKTHNKGTCIQMKGKELFQGIYDDFKLKNKLLVSIICIQVFQCCKC